MNNRRRGFGTPDTDLAERVRDYAAEHPEATQQQIAEAVDCHRHTVRKALLDDGGLYDSSLDSGSGHDSSHDNIRDSNSSRVHAPRSVSTPTAFLQSPPAVNVQTTREGGDGMNNYSIWLLSFADGKGYALQQAISGKEWTGWKLIEGRSNRKYTSEAAVAATVESAGFDPYEQKSPGCHRHAENAGQDPLGCKMGKHYHQKHTHQ